LTSSADAASDILCLAHEIRNQSSRAFRAVASLNGKIRWCLTGTPIQNRLEDLGSLVRFLQVPFLSTPRDYKTYCINPVLSKQAEGFGNIRTLLQTICIRRTKELLELPKFKTIEHRLTLSKDERTQYRDITRAYKTAIDDAISGRKPADAYRSIFQALLDLRLLCNHGSRDLSIKRETDDFMALFQEGPILCAYCESKLSVENPSEQTPAAIISSCSHIVCSECLDKVRGDMKRLESGSKVKCPSCSKRMLSEAGSPVIRFGTNSEPEDSDDSICSTKFAKIIEDISKHSSTEKWYGLGPSSNN
jgi:SNF2 family DNA or RNA helicase